MITTCPSPQDRGHCDNVSDHGCDHDYHVHAGFDDLRDLLVRRVNGGARSMRSTVGVVQNGCHFAVVLFRCYVVCVFFSLSKYFLIGYVGGTFFVQVGMVSDLRDKNLQIEIYSGFWPGFI